MMINESILFIFNLFDRSQELCNLIDWHFLWYFQDIKHSNPSHCCDYRSIQ